MALIALASLIGLGLLSILWLRRYHHLLRKSKPAVQRFDEPDICHKILACENFNDLAIDNSVDRLYARAIPNKRLVEVFGINNAFTTSDREKYNRFRSHAKGKIGGYNDSKWSNVASVAERTVEQDMSKPLHQGGVYLKSLVQCVTLKMSLFVLFDAEPFDMDHTVVIQVADAINLLWLESKDMERTQQVVQREQNVLSKGLERLLSPKVLADEPAPLELILPAYETLWRVVFHCFAEIVLRPNKDKSGWEPALAFFLRNPTKTQFIHFGDSDLDVSVSNLVNEALRLYPPTRRVYRNYKLEGKNEFTMVAADIEACHRSCQAWGEDSMLFVPKRWKQISTTAPAAFMPFGERPFICPAKPNFGPHMIGVLVAALAAKLPGKSWAVVYGNDNFDFENIDQPLQSSRIAYDLLEIWQ